MSFSPATLRFLRGLAAHNNKPWFEAHRGDYEAAVKAPMQVLTCCTGYGVVRLSSNKLVAKLEVSTDLPEVPFITQPR